MRRANLTLIALLAGGVALYAWYNYLLAPGWPQLHPGMRASFDAHRGALLAHIGAAGVALGVGPLQFMARVRRHVRVHRAIGMVYLLAVLAGAAGGLVLAQSAFGGLTSVFGFSLLALAWAASALMAVRHALQGRYAAHRRWMIRNYALTFAAVTLRLYLPAALMAGVPFETAYPLIAWACWLPNLLVAELLCRSGSS